MTATGTYGAPSRALGVALALAALTLAFGWHIALGAKTIPLETVLQALLAPDPTDFDHMVVRDLRLPRAVFAVLVGAALAVAGALMQGVTQNPLAEPGLLGLLAGASFAVVMAIGVFGLAGTIWLPPIAAGGALAATLAVWAIASSAPGGASPLTLVLSGAAVSAFLAALVAMANLIDEDSFENLRVWLTGTLAGRSKDVMFWTLPWLLAGLGVSLAVARQITALAMGDATATGLGVSVVRLKALVLFAVVALTASAVAIAGPMGFVGLIVPHVVRVTLGHDYRVIVPFSALFGATFLLVADIAARMALAPVEVSTGIVTALLGAPVFIWLVRMRL
ncbi:iron ABC transporter permease [Roseivivax sp. GX 12232]|uniref:FecCD family ABC transporter permease n=1 Tax=Roseivivax sp. GX 12232 TaxID=2900547 RepID=UPI001E635823|nr:iron ABC transporter permease [Roseivivax sp. GX 12232]MCE0505906.1 iron ABC transporter permease [Roseivivax sp. GX 12232]